MLPLAFILCFCILGFEHTLYLPQPVDPPGCYYRDIYNYVYNLATVIIILMLPDCMSVCFMRESIFKITAPLYPWNDQHLGQYLTHKNSASFCWTRITLSCLVDVTPCHVFLSPFLILCFQVSLFNYVFLISWAFALPYAKLRRVASSVCTVWTCVIIVCKMLYQLQTIKPENFSVNCSLVSLEVGGPFSVTLRGSGEIFCLT